MGTPIKNKVLDASGILKPQYWTVRYARDGVVSGDYHLELLHAVEDDILHNVGIHNLEKVEWCGNHIGNEWRDVTDWYRNAYHERTTGDEA